MVRTAQGFTKTEYADQDPIWAHIEYADTVMDGLADGVQVRDAVQMRATIRYHDTVHTEWRIKYRGEIWTIVSVQHQGIKDDVMLRCRTGLVTV